MFCLRHNYPHGTPCLLLQMLASFRAATEHHPGRSYCKRYVHMPASRSTAVTWKAGTNLNCIPRQAKRLAPTHEGADQQTNVPPRAQPLPPNLGKCNGRLRNRHGGRLPRPTRPVVCLELPISHVDAIQTRIGHQPQGGRDNQQPRAHRSSCASECFLPQDSHLGPHP